MRFIVIALLLTLLAILSGVAVPGRSSSALLAAENSREGTAESVRDPSSSQQLLVRFDVGGGLLRSPATELPRWSLYDDGLLVWTDEGDATPGFTRRVWTGYASNDEILELMDFIEAVGFWDLDEHYRPAHVVDAGGKRIRLDPAAGLDQTWSTLTVHAGQREKQVTVYPADWEGAPVAFISCRERLLEVQPEGPREFEPEAFRLEVSSPSGRIQTRPREWPFQDIHLPVPSGTLSLTRDQGLAVAEFLRGHPPVVAQNDKPVELRLVAEPPREP